MFNFFADRKQVFIQATWFYFGRDHCKSQRRVWSSTGMTLADKGLKSHQGHDINKILNTQMNAPKWPPTKQYVPHLLTHLYEYSESWTCGREILIPFQCRGNVRLWIAMSCKIRLQYALFDAHIWTVTDSGVKVKALSEIICKCFIVYPVFFSAVWLNCRQVWMFCKHLSCRAEISNISAFALVLLWFL